MASEQPAERPHPLRDDGGGQAAGAGRREDGVRIIEGSMLGQRGLDDLQTDLARWELINNVSEHLPSTLTSKFGALKTLILLR